MKKQNYTHVYLRTIANELASKANNCFNKAKVANTKYEFYSHKVSLARNFLLNSPWVLFTILYFLILVVDAVLMEPIIQVVVQHGFKMTSTWSLYLFIGVYILLVSGLTIGVAYGFSKMLDHKLRELQIELETVSRPGVAKIVIADEILSEEQKEKSLGIVFGILLMTLLVSLSLYRNYIVNGFNLQFNSPDDWLNLILPIALGIALCFFGLYKDVVVKLLRFKAKVKRYEEEKDEFHSKSNYLSRQALEQDSEAVKNGESIPYSAELNEAINRYKNNKQADAWYYDDKKRIQVNLIAKGLPVPNVQVTSITGDNETVFKITDNDGIAIIEWITDCDFVRNLKIGSYDVKGNKWHDGQMISIDLEDFISGHKPQLNGQNYLEKRLTNI